MLDGWKRDQQMNLGRYAVATARGLLRSVETRMKMSAAFKGRIVTSETRAKISLGNMGKVRTPEEREKRAAARRGSVATPEARENMSKAQRRRVLTPEAWEKIASASRGEANKNSKLDSAKVLDIRRRLAAGETQAVIARRYGVTPGTICNIKTGRRWSSVGE